MSDLVRGSRVLLLLLSMSRFSNNEHLLLVLFKFSHLSFIIITINYLQTFKVNIFSTKVEMPLKKVSESKRSRKSNILEGKTVMIKYIKIGDCYEVKF